MADRARRIQGVERLSHVATPPWFEQVPRRLAANEYVRSRHLALAPDGAVGMRGASKLRSAKGGVMRAGSRSGVLDEPMRQVLDAAMQLLPHGIPFLQLR
jgi:hypothetical protein